MKIITFDIEDWYHLLDFKFTETEFGWLNFESRIKIGLELIYNLLNETETKATFFCLGWIAKRYPLIIKDIVSLGYEIGSHSGMHQLIYEMTPGEFKKDLDYSIKILQDLTGKRIRYYRAPGFSIRENNKWALEILAEYGIEIDCSIFPAKHQHGGTPTINISGPMIFSINGIKIKELPINYIKLGKLKIMFSGGGYFRLFPYFLIEKWTKKSEYIMSYFHPRDFDANQPIIEGLNMIRRFKTYIGIKSAYKKALKWLSEFKFYDIAEADNYINWSAVRVINL